jgi:hypothetical protein
VGRGGTVRVSTGIDGDIWFQTEWTVLLRSCVDKLELGTKARCFDCLDLG